MSGTSPFGEGQFLSVMGSAGVLCAARPRRGGGERSRRKQHGQTHSNILSAMSATKHNVTQRNGSGAEGTTRASTKLNSFARSGRSRSRAGVERSAVKLRSTDHANGLNEDCKCSYIARNPKGLPCPKMPNRFRMCAVYTDSVS